MQEITSSQTTQTSNHPIPVLAQIYYTNFAETIIWHWSEITCYIISCNFQKRKGEEEVKVITYFPENNLTVDTTETDYDGIFADSRATSSQSENQILTEFALDSSESHEDANSPVYTPPMLNFTGEALYQTNSINDSYQKNTTSSNDVQVPSSNENNEHFFVGGKIAQIENNESNSVIVKTKTREHQHNFLKEY